METVAEAAHRVRRTAEAGPIGKRKTSFELYALLADCMALAERCTSDRAAFDEMRGLVAQQPHDGNRRYVEMCADAYQLVCRFVFADLKSRGAERSNASRYAMALREAAKIGVKSADLAAHLRDGGGINSLFLARPLAARSVTTRMLHLTQSITAPKDEEITLTLRRISDGRFDVISTGVAA